MNCRQLPNGDMAEKERERGVRKGEIWREESEHRKRRDDEKQK